MILPQDLDAERAVLGAVLSDGEAYRTLSALISAEDFAVEKHRRIWLAMDGIAQVGGRVEPMTVAFALRDAGHLESVGGVTYLNELDGDIGAIMGGEPYAARVREKSVLRQTIALCHRIIGQCEQHGDSREVLQQAEQVLRDLGAASVRDRKLLKAGEIIQERGGFERFLEGTKATVPLPWNRLNDILAGGFRPSELIVLAAATSAGKSAAATQIAEYAGRHGIHTAQFSLEMSREENLMRMIVVRSGIDAAVVRHNRMDKGARALYQQTAMEIDAMPIWFDDTAGASVAAIHAALRARNQPWGLVVVDYLQLVETVGKFGSRAEAVGSLSRGLKRLAMDFRCPVLALSQINRAADDLSAPDLRHLRESGSIEQDANTVMFLWRKESPMQAGPVLRMGAAVAKQRSGPCASADLLYVRSQLRFVEEDEAA